MEWATGDVAWPTLTATSSSVALGKRHRETEVSYGDEGPVEVDTHKVLPPKRARGGKGAKRILTKVEQSTARTLDKPVARIPKKKDNRKPKEAGRGAERLATPSAHGIYHHPLPGPSFQQDWSVEAAHGQPTWVEGSVDEEEAHHIDGMVQQQQQVEVTKLFKIPRIFKPVHRLFLQASEADFARGAVQAIRCRVCPGMKVKDFEEFKGHCNTSETHPLEIHFCERCGEYFARHDSLNRHKDKPPDVCLEVTQEDAAEKCRVTEEQHQKFAQRLEYGLMTGGEIGPSFFEIMRKIYPKSVKKRTGGHNGRGQLRVKGH